MCGIFGYSGFKGDGEKLLRIMADQQIHRGPDDEGFYIDGSFGFGLRRLSVIDIETGHQPICNEDETIYVVCNGEIYNHRELTKTLQQKGHRFRTKSDVECIVHLYEDLGIDCLKHLNGMFGLAIYDARQKCMYVARDRLGIKPLYYSALPNSFLFSSELRSLLATRLVTKELDWNSLSMFLDNMYIATPATPFKEISKLKAGHYMKIANDGTRLEKAYWKLDGPVTYEIPGSQDEAIEQLTDLLRDSARLQLRADVPLCVFLSGGIDSSAVAAFAAMESSHPLRSYHVFFENSTSKIDERNYALSVAKRYGTTHFEVAIRKEDFRQLIPTLIWHLEEPFADLASVPTYVISRMASKEATVCLNGSGGDELFAGYSYHSYPAIIKRKLLDRMNRFGVEGLLRSALGRTNSSRRWAKLFPNYINKSFQLLPDDKGHSFQGDLINKVLATDIDGYLQSNVLFLLDKIAMAVSLEGRVPLLDHRIVEFASHLPSCWKRKNGEQKYIFKKAMEPFLPKEVIYRKKEGFGAPCSDWLCRETRSILESIVENGFLKKTGMLVTEGFNLAAMNSWDLWKISCLELWYQIIVEGSECPNGVTLRDFA